MSISDLRLKRILNKPREKQTVIADSGGLSVRVSTKGTITWFWRYRFDGKSQQLKIGRYPDVSIKEAREFLPKFRRQLDEGLNPSFEKKVAIEEVKSALTIEDCFDHFMKAHKGKYKDTSLAAYTQVYNHHISKHILPPVDRITVQHWFQHFDKYENPKRAQAAYRKLKSCLSWCYERHLIKRPSILDIRGKNIGQSEEVGTRVLTLTEVKTFVEGVLTSKGAITMKLCVLWIVLTGCRRSEAREMEWEDLDLTENVWTIPAHKSKTKKPIRRPITDTLRLIIQLIPDEQTGMVFKGRGPNGGFDNKAVWRKFNTGYQYVLKHYENTESFSPHDFRRTISTRLSEEGIMPHVTEKMLGHVLQGVMAAYNKHDWLSEQAIAYEKWANLVMPRPLSECAKDL